MRLSGQRCAPCNRLVRKKESSKESKYQVLYSANHTAVQVSGGLSLCWLARCDMRGRRCWEEHGALAVRAQEVFARRPLDLRSQVLGGYRWLQATCFEAATQWSHPVDCMGHGDHSCWSRNSFVAGWWATPGQPNVCLSRFLGRIPVVSATLPCRTTGACN